MTDALGRNYGSAECRTCGTGFERTNVNSAYCDEVCRPSRTQHRRCAYCAEWFDAPRAPAKTRRKFGDTFQRCCGKACALRLTAAERNPSTPWPASCCGWCDRPIPPSRLYCSRTCTDYSSSRNRFTPIEYGNCRECGCLFVGRTGRAKAYCSDRCATRSAHRTRRHRERQAQREGEQFTLRQIADRDGWCCHLCGKAVPDRPSRSRPTDPTIDHLIPLSDGGSHTWDNVALAHFRCNWQRGATGPAQLRLTG